MTYRCQSTNCIHYLIRGGPSRLRYCTSGEISADQVCIRCRRQKQAAASTDIADLPAALDETQIEDLVSEFAGILEIVPGTAAECTWPL